VTQAHRRLCLVSVALRRGYQVSHSIRPQLHHTKYPRQGRVISAWRAFNSKVADPRRTLCVGVPRSRACLAQRDQERSERPCTAQWVAAVRLGNRLATSLAEFLSDYSGSNLPSCCRLRLPPQVRQFCGFGVGSRRLTTQLS